MTIYVTHGRGDHSFGISILRERFPDARAVATLRVLQHMRKQAAPDFLQSFWKSRFPRQLPDEIVFPDALEGDQFELEGHDLVAVDLGHNDTDNTTCLYVPSIKLGDSRRAEPVVVASIACPSFATKGAFTCWSDLLAAHRWHARSGHQQLRLAVIGWSRLPFTDVRPGPRGRHPIEQGAILARPRGRAEESRAGTSAEGGPK